MVLAVLAPYSRPAADPWGTSVQAAELSNLFLDEAALSL
jgi:hypothetical protein